MSGDNLDVITLLCAWIAWSLANASARVGRIANELERLRQLAERGRR